MYTLYYSPGTASMLVHLMLLECGAAFELREVDLEHGGQRDPAYLKLNPSGVVPTLLIDDEAYCETAALALILSERHPAAQMAPAPGSAARIRFLQGMVYLANTLQPAFRMWFYPSEMPGVDGDAVKATAQTRIEACWERLDAKLASHGPYLLGAQVSALDLYATMLMRWSRNMPRPASQWPQLANLAKTIRSRPSWQAMMATEGLAVWE